MVLDKIKNKLDLQTEVSIPEEDVLKYIVDYENTQLLENDVLLQIEKLDKDPKHMFLEKEREGLKKRLNEIRDRYRLNPIVEETGKDDFKIKYVFKDGKIVYNNLSDTPIASNSGFKLELEDDDELTETTKPIEKSGIKEVDDILKNEVKNTNNAKLKSLIKISPPNPRRQYKNPDYDGKYRITNPLIFRVITDISYKKYYKIKNRKKRYFYFEPSEFVKGDIIPFEMTKLYVKPKIDKKLEQIKKTINYISNKLNVDNVTNTTNTINQLVKSDKSNNKNNINRLFISRDTGKSAGIGQSWIYALTVLFGLTVLVFTMNMVFHEYLAPTLIDTLPDDAVGDSAETGIRFFLGIWDYLPYIIGFMVAVFIFIISIKREPIERY